MLKKKSLYNQHHKPAGRVLLPLDPVGFFTRVQDRAPTWNSMRCDNNICALSSLSTLLQSASQVNLSASWPRV